MFSKEICGVFKNTYFEEHLRTTAPKNFLWNSLNFKVSQYGYITENEWTHLTHIRSSRPELYCKKRVLRNFAKFTGKHLCKSIFFNTVAVLKPATLFKKRLWHRCFPVNFTKFLRTPFLQNTTGGSFCQIFLYFVFRSIFNLLLKKPWQVEPNIWSKILWEKNLSLTSSMVIIFTRKWNWTKYLDN